MIWADTKQKQNMDHLNIHKKSVQSTQAHGQISFEGSVLTSNNCSERSPQDVWEPEDFSGRKTEVDVGTKSLAVHLQGEESLLMIDLRSNKSFRESVSRMLEGREIKERTKLEIQIVLLQKCKERNPKFKRLQQKLIDQYCSQKIKELTTP